jgi:Pyruvate/2-oxoacid:ferredoxin oxidoreductase delta subunit
MCEFCHKHGEGEKWYLQAKNYSEDLLNDLRRRKFVENLGPELKALMKEDEKFEQLQKMPAFVRAVLTPYISNKRKKTHFGQVLPIEDIENIFGFVNHVVRLACACRNVHLGSDKERYCYGVSLSPQGGIYRKRIKEIDPGYLTGPDTPNVEVLTKEKALDYFRQYEKEGLCHTVWTFITPFIGGICNCDRSDCNAMKANLHYGVPVMFRAEYVAQVNPELCNGCRQCMRVCQFGAMGYSAANKKTVIDIRRCYGCGICRASCTKDAIKLYGRSSVPASANIW